MTNDEHKREASAEIERLTQEFLANGNKIRKIPIGIGVGWMSTAAKNNEQARSKKVKKK